MHSHVSGALLWGVPAPRIHPWLTITARRRVFCCKPLAAPQAARLGGFPRQPLTHFFCGAYHGCEVTFRFNVLILGLCTFINRRQTIFIGNFTDCFPTTCCVDVGLAAKTAFRNFTCFQIPQSKPKPYRMPIKMRLLGMEQELLQILISQQRRTKTIVFVKCLVQGRKGMPGSFPTTR